MSAAQEALQQERFYRSIGKLEEADGYVALVESRLDYLNAIRRHGRTSGADSSPEGGTNSEIDVCLVPI